MRGVCVCVCFSFRSFPVAMNMGHMFCVSFHLKPAETIQMKPRLKRLPISLHVRYRATFDGNPKEISMLIRT